LGEGAIGKGGDINIKTGMLSLSDRAELTTDTSGTGDAGNIFVQAKDSVSLAGSKTAIYSDVKNTGVGNAGVIEIKARSLSMRDRASLNSSTSSQQQDTTGQPSRAGMISLQADDGINLENSSYIFNNVESGAVGQGGEVKIKTGSLSLRNGSQIQTIVRGAYENQLPGKGNAGNINIQASKDVIFDGFSNTDLAERQNIFFSGITSDVESGVKGNAGNIEITTPKDIRLDNKASIRANTSGGKGNIILNSRDLILRRNSNITTNATGSATGGNITIKAENLVAVPQEDSNISADAEESFGGKVSINAQGIFGIKFRKQPTLESDITASSERGLEFSGEVKLNLPNVDPSHGLVELPKNVVDPTEQIAQNPCQRGVGSKFIITGSGGLPPSPNEATSSDAVRVDLVEPAPEGSRGAGEQRRRETEQKNKSSVSKPIVPAQGWIFNKNGEVILTAYDPTGTGSQRPLNSDVCPVP
ncbi:filamentous hemagglutinin, partial [Nostoc sp. UIC 10607]